MLFASGFVGEVMFSHVNVNVLESKTTRMFRPVCRMAALVGRQTTLSG